MIMITLNGKKEELVEGVSVAELLKKKNIRSEVVTVEHNGRILNRDEFLHTMITHDDRIELVFFMGGGGSTQSLSAISLTIEDINCFKREGICLLVKG